MTAPIAKATPLESLPVIEQEFAAGNYVESSRLLWEATKNTFLMLGKAHGLDTDDALAIARALDEKDLGKCRYMGLLIAGWVARDHARTAAFEPYEIEISHRRLPDFIRWSHREFGPDKY